MSGPDISELLADSIAREKALAASLRESKFILSRMEVFVETLKGDINELVNCGDAFYIKRLKKAEIEIAEQEQEIADLNRELAAVKNSVGMSKLVEDNLDLERALAAERSSSAFWYRKRSWWDRISNFIKQSTGRIYGKHV